MSGKRTFRLIVFGLALTGYCCAQVRAAPPWTDMVSPKQVEAEPDKTYTLTENNGPWMIMACSFSGEGAEKQAQDLVCELRKRYKLPAYINKEQFDFGDPKGLKLDRYGSPVKMRYYKNPKITEVAVLVGDYATVDDAEAQKVLKKLKYTMPQCLDVKTNKGTYQTLAGYRSLQAMMGSSNKEKGPMAHAFITTNPLLPKDYFVPGGLDPLVIEMNKNVPHDLSLLECPGKYSVQVATFKGQVIIKQDEIEAIEKGEKQFNGDLTEAAMKAHQLTEALRMKGYEAYEFHDRNASIVTVGSFDSVGMPRADGKIEINPKIHKIMQTFGAKPLDLTGQVPKDTIPMACKTLAGINFDIQPIPIMVPKKSISAALSRPPVE
ncbi:MAG: hypothetical protein ABSE63_00185 [Thermoguttaceae bacterium]|jgi:hypothetical protein